MRASPSGLRYVRDGCKVALVNTNNIEYGSEEEDGDLKTVTTYTRILDADGIDCMGRIVTSGSTRAPKLRFRCTAESVLARIKAALLEDREEDDSDED